MTSQGELFRSSVSKIIIVIREKSITFLGKIRLILYRHDYGTFYMIAVYSWYFEGGDMKVLLDTRRNGLPC